MLPRATVIGFGLKAKFWIVALICMAAGVGVVVGNGSAVTVGAGSGVAGADGVGVHACTIAVGVAVG